MGFKLSKVPVPCVLPNREAEVTAQVQKEQRGVIHGVVMDEDGQRVRDALVKLFVRTNPHDPCCLQPLGHTFTDDCGQFLFAVQPGKEFVIKIQAHDEN